MRRNDRRIAFVLTVTVYAVTLGGCAGTNPLRPANPPWPVERPGAASCSDAAAPIASRPIRRVPMGAPPILGRRDADAPITPFAYEPAPNASADELIRLQGRALRARLRRQREALHDAIYHGPGALGLSGRDRYPGARIQTPARQQVEAQRRDLRALREQGSPF